MKKLTKITALLLSLALLLALAACGGDPKPSEGPAAEVTYTFTGAYDSSQSDVHFDFKLEMLSDGTLKMAPGVVFLDVEDHQATASGTWSVDDSKTLKFTVNSEDNAFNKDYEVPFQDGGYAFELSLSLSSFVRPITMTCTTPGFVPTPAATPAPTEAPAGDDTGDTGDEPSYPANTMVMEFTPDTSDKLKTTFYCESGVWGVALGASGSYEPTDSSDVLFSWTSGGSSNYHLDFKADGTYEYQFTTVGVTETGTWSFSGWTMTATTAKGSTFTAEITK